MKILNKTFILILLITITTLGLDWLIFLLNKIPNLSIPGLATIGDKILFATFLALIWYAWETKRIREIEQEPIIDLYYRPKTQTHEAYLRLRNSGEGTAYNIKVEPIKDSNIEFDFFFKDPNLILTKDTKQTLTIEQKVIKGEWHGNALESFLSFIREKPINPTIKGSNIINISYRNYSNKKFERKFKVYNRFTEKLDKKYKKSVEIELIK